MMSVSVGRKPQFLRKLCVLRIWRRVTLDMDYLSEGIHIYIHCIYTDEDTVYLTDIVI